MKVLIADDHDIFRHGFALFLDNIDKSMKVYQAATYSGAAEVLKKEKDIDLFILDLDMPDMGWEEGIKFIKGYLHSGLKLIVLSAIENMSSIRKSFEIGAKGFIPKRATPEVVESAINIVISGGSYIPDTMEKYILSSGDTKQKQKGEVLTPKQLQVLKYIATGLSNKQIAYELKVTESTIKLHINSIFKALKVTNRTQAVVDAQAKGVI